MLFPQTPFNLSVSQIASRVGVGGQDGAFCHPSEWVLGYFSLYPSPDCAKSQTLVLHGDIQLSEEVIPILFMVITYGFSELYEIQTSAFLPLIFPLT